MFITKTSAILQFLWLALADTFIGSAIIFIINVLLNVIFNVPVAIWWVIICSAATVTIARMVYKVITKQWIFMSVGKYCLVINTQDIDKED